LVDTNILLYFLKGNKKLTSILKDREIVISFVTELELLSFPELTKKDEKIIKELIDNCVVVDLNEEIKAKTINIRRSYAQKLPDAIIAATAEYFGLPLFTADQALGKVKDIDVVIFEI